MIILDLGLHVGRVYTINRGLYKNLSDLSLAVRGRDVCFLFFRVLVDRCICSKVWLIGYECWLYTCVKSFWHIDSAIMSVVVVKSVVRICSSGNHFYVYCVYQNPDLSNIFLLFVTLMAKVQSVGRKTFLYVFDVNAHRDK